MADVTAAKSWTIATSLNRERQLAFDLGENGITISNGTSPVEQLLAAVGACFVQSCAAVMQHQEMAAAGLGVSVSGHKPAGPIRGKGLNRIDIVVRFDRPIAQATRDRILKDTKAVCTVTNTLSKDVEIAVTSVAGDAPQ